MFVFPSFQTSLVVWQMNSRSLIHLNKYTLKVIWWYVHSTFPNKQPCIFGYQITKTIRWKIVVVMSLYLSSILFVNYLICMYSILLIESKLEQNPHCVLTHEISLESYKFSWENVAIFSVSSYSERAEVRITLWKKNNCGVSILQGCQSSWILNSYSSGAVGGKTGKTLVLPGFSKIECDELEPATKGNQSQLSCRPHSCRHI